MADQRYAIPVWTITYPIQVRDSLAQAYLELTGRHALTRLCMQALSTSCDYRRLPHLGPRLMDLYIDFPDLKPYQNRRAQWPIGSHIRQAALSSLDPKFLEYAIDPESLITEALKLARSPPE